MVVRSQLMPADWARIVLILNENKRSLLVRYTDLQQQCYSTPNPPNYPQGRGEDYQPWLEARGMEKMLARQLLHLVVHNQVFTANGTLRLTTQSGNDFLSYC